MPEFAIKVPQPDFKYAEHSVFYSDNEITVYREGPYVRAVNKSDEEIIKIRCPSNFKHFESVDLGNSVMIVFSGSQVILINKNNYIVSAYELETNKIGTCITPIKTSKNKSIVFGTRIRDSIQFVTYDYQNKKRISQTSSWKMSNIDDFEIYNDDMYALIDSAFLINSNVETCEPKWTRFETGKIAPKIVPSKDCLYYACGGVLKKLSSSIQSFRVPLIKVDSVEARFGDNLILTSADKSNLCCFDVSKEEVRWQIRSNLKIDQTEQIKILVSGKTNDGLLVMTKDHITIVDCTKGRNVYHTEFKNIARIRKTGSNILVHKYNGTTGIIKGEVL